MAQSLGTIDSNASRNKNPDVHGKFVFFRQLDFTLDEINRRDFKFQSPWNTKLMVESKERPSNDSLIVVSSPVRNITPSVTGTRKRGGYSSWGRTFSWTCCRPLRVNRYSTGEQ